MGDAEHIVVRVESDIDSVDASEWDACADPKSEDGTRIHPYNPFLSHAFLSALEVSNCVDPSTGWMPQHLLIENEAGALAAVMPCYLKSHSMGEYVFDYAWADAFERAGGRYYPKLQSCIPFTPVTGRRLLVGEQSGSERLENALLSGAIELVNRMGASSLHLTFPTKDEWRRMGQIGFLQRTDQQFHWFNQDYGSFDDFLGQLTARKRKAIRKERRAAAAADIEIEWITGADFTEQHWSAFYGFYMDTGARKWGSPYLNRQFFSLIGETMADELLLILARRSGRIIAGALNFIGSEALYGRYWGCIEDHRFLHFELCYYQAIDYAIEHGLKIVEAGAQGPHKLARGYMPMTTYSAHYIADASLRRAIDQFLERERSYVDMENRALAQHAPFRKDGGSLDGDS